MKARILICALAVVLAQPMVSLADGWDPRLFNPKPLDDDVVLPMPCGGAMTFRKVVIESTGLLDDKQIAIGGAEDNWGYLENTNTVHVSGGFSRDEGRYLLIGKYELTELQYAAVTETECPKPTARGRLPKAGLNWYDAVAYTNEYNLWLRTNAVESLPKEDGVSGFVRLPTEIEWEFATRGGIRVGDAERNDRVFPMESGIANYAWYAGTESANGSAQAIGLKEPNPLGLHETLGNLDEIVLEPFHMRLNGRPHGQVGSFVVRGGNFFTDKADLRSAYRHEAPYYVDSEPRRAKTTGVRLLISAPALTSAQRIALVKQEWQTLGKVVTNGPLGEPSEEPTSDLPAGEPKDDPIDELQALSEAIENKEIKARLVNARMKLKEEFQSRNAQRVLAAKSSLRLGAFLCIKLSDDKETLESWEQSKERNCRPEKNNPQSCQRWTNRVDQASTALRSNVEYYADTITASLDYDDPTLQDAFVKLRQELTAKGLTKALSYANLHRDHINGFASSGLTQRTEWLDACRAGP